MARMSISVPDELKQRMDAVGDRVNWSRLAQEVWDRAAAKPMEGGKMNEMVTRLKASKAEFEEKERTAGKEAGAEWAEKLADYEDLRGVAKAYAGWQNDTNGTSIWAYLKAAPIDNEVVEEAIGTDYADHRDIDYSRHVTIAEEFLEGWCQGAAEAFEEVEGQL